MDGVILTPLKQIYNAKGDIFHAMKKSDIGFSKFGEAYFSSINHNIIKGWKKHTKMILNLIVLVGAIKFVVFNDKTNDFYSVELSKDNYQRLTIKAGLWLAFKGVNKNNTLLNIASLEHDLNEAVNVNLNEIKYEW